MSQFTSKNSSINFNIYIINNNRDINRKKSNEYTNNKIFFLLLTTIFAISFLFEIFA